MAAFLRRELSKARRDTQEVVQLNVFFLGAKLYWKSDIIASVDPDLYDFGPPGWNPLVGGPEPSIIKQKK